MTSASNRGWGDPGPPGSPQGTRYRTQHIVPISAGGRTLFVRSEAARLFKGFIDEIVRNGYSIADGEIDDWGYNHRYIHGTKVLSNHAWGLAVDLNARTNPQGVRLVTDMPAWVIDTAERWGLHWGGYYTDAKKDPMHFEFVGTPHDVTRYPLPTHEEDDLQPDERDAVLTANHFVKVLWPEAKKELDATKLLATAALETAKRNEETLKQILAAVKK